MKVLITGAGSQLARELQVTAPRTHTVVARHHSQLDISHEESVFEAVQEVSPDLILNTAAYTAVDRAEKERSEAFRVNAWGAASVARAAASVGARLIHFSTDFVFSGGGHEPLRPDHPPSPINAYGESKLKGESEVMATLGSAAVIMRTAWVYSRFGRNFVKTMLDLMSSESRIRVVDDQIGSPTWARGLARATWKIAKLSELSGIQHWTDDGETSWYRFALAIQQDSNDIGLIDSNCEVDPVSTADYPRQARRPAYSVLDKSSTWQALGSSAPEWGQQLRAMLQDLKDHADA